MSTATEALTPAQAAAAAARYHDLKQVVGYVIRGGEVVAAKQYERELELLNATLKAYVLANGPIAAEGLPELSVVTPESEDVDVPALFEHEPDIGQALLSARCLKVDTKTGRKVLSPEQLGRFQPFIHRVAGASRLVFGRRP